MPKAKLKYNHRQTRAIQTRKKRQKKHGRPKGTHKRYLFEETRLGFFLKYECPAVYLTIVLLSDKNKHYLEPPVLLIKTVCEKSDDVSLRKPKFERYLEDYNRMGLYCMRAKKLTPARKKFYDAIRQNKLNKNQQLKIKAL